MWEHLKDDIVKEWPYNEEGANMFSSSYYAVYSQTSWAKIQQFYLGHENSHRRSRWGARTIPLKLMRNINWYMTHMGKLFFNDPLWETYDVVITVDAYSASSPPLCSPLHRPSARASPCPRAPPASPSCVQVSQSMHSGFEQWVRTAKTFLVDHYQETPCLREGAKEGAFMTLTALPFKDYLNVAVGAARRRMILLLEQPLHSRHAL